MNDTVLINSDFNKFTEFFLEENSKHNLISKNDEKFLYEKHIYDSLGIKLFFDKYGEDFGTILDIGCGGGFPCIPIAVEYPQIIVTGLDSIRKKTASVENIKNKLNLKNLNVICDRAENLIRKSEFSLVTSRAVASLSKIVPLAIPLLKKGGYFIAYKSKKAEEEITDANKILTKMNAEIIDIIKYKLPLKENYERKLICIKKK